MVQDKFLARCLSLANKARGRTYPNPIVGAVIVHNGKIIGEGYHQKVGKEHAEVMAIQSVKDRKLLKDSTLYCSLEPCAHFGHTPPCSLRIVQEGIPRVVVGCLDPHSKVNGKGIQIMEKAGIHVRLSDEPYLFEQLNEVFFTNKSKNRSFFMLKWAASKDGFIDRIRLNAKEVPAKISGDLAAIRTHQLRAQCDGILISAKTLNLDSPTLTTRFWTGSNARPIILVGDHFLPDQGALKKLKNPLLIGKVQTFADEYDTHCMDTRDLPQLATTLLSYGIHCVLVEGGAQLHQSFVQAGLADRIVRYTNVKKLESGVSGITVDSQRNISTYLGTDLYELF